MKVFISLFFICFVIFCFFLSCFFLSFSFSSEDEKGTPFECGFSSFSSFGVPPISIPFFIVSLMFLLFDIEIVLLLFFPFVFSFSYYSSFFLWLASLMVLFSTLYEWYKGLFVWL